jgi:hypothetical protein
MHTNIPTDEQKNEVKSMLDNNNADKQTRYEIITFVILF